MQVGGCRGRGTKAPVPAPPWPCLDAGPAAASLQLWQRCLGPWLQRGSMCWEPACGAWVLPQGSSGDRPGARSDCLPQGCRFCFGRGQIHAHVPMHAWMHINVSNSHARTCMPLDSDTWGPQKSPHGDEVFHPSSWLLHCGCLPKATVQGAGSIQLLLGYRQSVCLGYGGDGQDVVQIVVGSAWWAGCGDGTWPMSQADKSGWGGSTHLRDP